MRESHEGQGPTWTRKGREQSSVSVVVLESRSSLTAISHAFTLLLLGLQEEVEYCPLKEAVVEGEQQGPDTAQNDTPQSNEAPGLDEPIFEDDQISETGNGDELNAGRFNLSFHAS
ncbi:unnamed protein product [Rodentolepis nana]|uniref:CTNNB1 binding N-teminal domain-containing protein n=1 Tax=Rodentolepis nana TaxID=102285 RepID=A0A0R3TIL2_RODNA|nr:unnamed protein product [Rodentolepis nana]